MRTRTPVRPVLRTLEERRCRAFFAVGASAGLLVAFALVLGHSVFSSGVALEQRERSERHLVLARVLNDLDAPAPPSLAPVPPRVPTDAAVPPRLEPAPAPGPSAGPLATASAVLPYRPLVRFVAPDGEEVTLSVALSQVELPYPGPGSARLWVDDEGMPVPPPRSHFTTVVHALALTLLLLALAGGLTRYLLRAVDRFVLVAATRSFDRDWEEISSQWSRGVPRQ